MKKGEADKTRVSATASEISQKGQRSKEYPDSTTFPSISTKPSEQVKIDPNCGCSNKRDAFFDKLLCYLEKQAEVISRCCLNEKGSSGRNKRSNTDPVFNKEESPPCLSVSDKYIHRSEDKLSKGQKSKENQCKITVEVCACDKKAIKPAASTKVCKSSSQNRPIQHKTTNEIDCSGCERKVENFFKLAEEICQAYLKRCLMNDDLNYYLSQYSEHNVRDEDPRKTTIQEREDNRDERGCNSLAIEVECHGDREEFVIQPCDCERKSGRSPSHYRSRTSQDETGGYQSPKKRCVEQFEERYGQILRELHSKLIKQNPQVGHGYSNPPQGSQPPPQRFQQQHPPSQQPAYPPPQNRQPDSRSQNSQAQPRQYPPSQDPYQQPQPYSQYQPYPPEQLYYPPEQPYYPPEQPYGTAPPGDPPAKEKNHKSSKSPDKGRRRKLN